MDNPTDKNILNEEDNALDLPLPMMDENSALDISPNEAQNSDTFMMAIKSYNETYINQVLSQFSREEINQDQAKRQIDRLLDTHAYNTRLHNEKVGYQDSQTPIFLTIPREIRQEILRYMLLSPVLGTRKSVKIWNGSATNESRYELETNVLLVCRLLNEEGTAVLYGENRFYNLCCDGYYWHSPHLLMNANPLNRFVVEVDPIHSRDHTFHRVMGKVKHWRVDLTETTNPLHSRPYTHLREFCNNLSRMSPLTVEFLLVPWGMEADFHVQTAYLDRKKLLSPIKLLRNVQTVAIREVTEQDYMEAYQNSWTFPAPPTTSPPGEEEQKAFETSLVELAQGNTPRESLFETYEQLLEYCQSFEQYQPFKKTMEYYPETTDFVTRSEYHNDLNTRFIDESFFLEHPVEHGLCVAKSACNNDDFKGFRAAQATVVAYLEPQYKRLSLSFQALRELILKLKTETGILDPSPYFEWKKVLEQEKYQSDAGMLMYLLDNYVQAFKRDVPPEIQAIITFHKFRYRAYYDTTFNPDCVFMATRLVEEAFERRVSSVFLPEFRKTVDKVDAEFFKIVCAREALGLNPLEYASHVDGLLGNCVRVQFTEVIDWRTDEFAGQAAEYADSLESWEQSSNWYDDSHGYGENGNDGTVDQEDRVEEDGGGLAAETTGDDAEIEEGADDGLNGGGNEIATHGDNIHGHDTRTELDVADENSQLEENDAQDPTLVLVTFLG